MKGQISQYYVFKINSSRLSKAKWRLALPLAEAKKNDELIAVSDCQAIRFIDEINGQADVGDTVVKLKRSIKNLKKQPDSQSNRKKIERLYEELDRLQFKPDLIHLVIDRSKDLRRACKGFIVNNIRYVRLLGTNGGIKNNTVVFVNEALAAELRRRIDNGRDVSVKLVPAKLEAYRALVCSGSAPVSMPKGILVVNDCITKFTEDIIRLSDGDGKEPTMEFIPNATIELNESDGYGLMSPALAKRWSSELGLGYVTGGVNTRFAWEKGMVFCFDFLAFADEVAKRYIVKDAWGDDVDIRDVELILTTSMLKLWSSYKNCKEYLAFCEANGYSFGISKVCPQELESERNLNYQFIQSYNLDNAQIEELINPTITEIHDILSDDYQKTILFLKGMYLNSDNVDDIDVDYAKAIMIEPKMMNDPYVKKQIFRLIKKRITDAKVGVIRVHGNYSVVSGDPYSLCQSIFGLEVTGLLKAGEIYNSYWAERDISSVVCFRAPMTCHNNIRVMSVAKNALIDKWYQYMTACTIFNSWDTTAFALNGMDKDGDLVLLTDNKVLLENTRKLPTLVCVQNIANKTIPVEDDLIQSNIDSFGDDIGKTTNWITSMFEVQSRFLPGSVEYETLDYRIKCGQLYQQNAIKC